MKTTWKKTALNLHDLRIYLSYNIITVLRSITFGIIIVKTGKLRDILIKVTSPGSGNNGVNNSRSASLVLTQSLVGGNEFLQLFQSLVQTSILSRRSQVRNSCRVRTSLCDSSLGRVVGSVQVCRWKRVDQAVRVTGS